MKHYNALKLCLNIANTYHGSGIDCDWYLKETQRYFVLSNSFHVMDDNGMYDGYMDFNVLIDKRKAKVHTIKFPGLSSYHRNKYMWIVRSYLEDCFFNDYFAPYTKRPYYLKVIKNGKKSC